MGLTEIREGLADALASIPDLQESAYLLANPTPPSAEVQPGPVEYDAAMARGSDRWTMTVRVFVGAVTDRGAQARLDKMLAPTGGYSVKAALQADRTLDGAAQTLRVVRCTGYRIFGREGAAPVLGAEWEVDVIASGT